MHDGPEFAAQTGMRQRGPKRSHQLDPDKLTTTTFRLPVALLMQLDQEAARVARETGITTVNRSDLARVLLAEALASRVSRAAAAPEPAK